MIRTLFQQETGSDHLFPAGIPGIFVEFAGAILYNVCSVMMISGGLQKGVIRAGAGQPGEEISMINIPMVTKKPMRASELGRDSRVERSRRVQELQEGRPASRGVPSGPGPVRNAPQPSRPAQAGRSRSTPVPPPVRRPYGHPHPPAAGAALQKGQKTSLSQMAPSLDLIKVGMGWDLGPGGQGYDLDVSAFLLDPAGKVLGDDWFVFYNQPVSPDGAVRLLETGVPGNSPADDKVIQVCLSQVNSGVSRIAFIVTINEALAHGRHFGNVADTYVRIVDGASRRELVRFRLTDHYSNVCSMVVGEVYRYKEEWRFNPVGNGTGDDLAGLCRRYGVDV